MAAITAVLAALYVALRVQPVVTLLVPLAGATLPLVARTHAGVRLAFRWGVALVGLFVAAGAMTVGALFVPTLIALVVGLRATGDRTTPGATRPRHLTSR